MRRMRFAAAIVLVASGVAAAVITSASRPSRASAATTTSTASTTSTTPTTPAKAPTATTGSTSDVGQSNATLSGTVNPNGQATTYYFEYGTTTAYGTQTSPASVGSGTTPVGVHAAIYGLTPNTTYHYRLVATNATGSTNGSDQTLTTPTTVQSHTAVLGHEGFVSPGWIVGAEVGCFHGTTTCTGHLTMSHAGVTIAQRNYSIPADSGGFQNMELNSTGKQDLKSNGVFNLLGVTVTATQTGGQTSTWTIHLARWVWH